MKRHIQPSQTHSKGDNIEIFWNCPSLWSIKSSCTEFNSHFGLQTLHLAGIERDDGHPSGTSAADEVGGTSSFLGKKLKLN